MSFFDWWFKHKDKKNTNDFLAKNIDILETSIPIQNQLSDINVFSHLPPLPKPYFAPEEFAAVLSEDLRKDHHNIYAKQHNVEALSIAQQSQVFMSEENKAAAIMSLIGEQEAMIALRAFRWRHGLHCPRCGSKNIKVKIDTKSNYIYRCLDCEIRHGIDNNESIFSDLTNLAFAKDIKSVIRWVLICYLKMFCSVGKIAKLLNISVDQALQLLSLVHLDESFKPQQKKKKDSF